MIALSPTEILQLKLLAVICHNLGRCIRDQDIQSEHNKLTKVLVDLINRAERVDAAEAEMRKFVFTATGYTQ